MNICHVITTIERGGAEKQLLTLTRNQVMAGNSVTVFYLKGENDLLEEFEKAGVQVQKLANTNSFMKQFFFAKSFIDGFYQIVHAHLPRSEILCAFTMHKSKLIISRHNTEKFVPFLIDYLSSYLSRIVTRRAKKVICISKSVQNYVVNKNEVADPKLCAVVYYGFDSTKARKSDLITEKQSNKSHSLSVGTISRLVPQKNLVTLLKAFKVIKANIVDSRLEIVGAGPLQSFLKNKSEELQINESTFFIGKITDVEKFLSRIDIFVLTSTYEGFGLVILEAMIAGTPIISTKVPSVIEILGPEYPFFVDFEDSAKIAEFVLNIYENCSEFDFASYYKNRLSQFDPVFVEKEIFKIYESSLSD